MQEFQQRVVDEKAELDAKLEKLRQFFSTEIFDALPVAEGRRLIKQESLMDAYSRILGERIEAFEVSPKPERKRRKPEVVEGLNGSGSRVEPPVENSTNVQPTVENVSTDPDTSEKPILTP